MATATPKWRRRGLLYEDTAETAWRSRCLGLTGCGSGTSVDIFASDWVGGQQFSWAVSSTDLRLQSTSITCSTIWRTLEWMVFRFCLRNWRRQAPSAIFSLVAGDYIGMCCAQDLLCSCRSIDLHCSLSLTGVSIPFTRYCSACSCLRCSATTTSTTTPTTTCIVHS